MEARSAIDVLVTIVGLVLVGCGVVSALAAFSRRRRRGDPKARGLLASYERHALSSFSLLIPALFAIFIGVLAIVTGLFGHNGVLGG